MRNAVAVTVELFGRRTRSADQSNNHGFIVSASIEPVTEALYAQRAATSQKIEVAIAAKAQDVTRQAGEVANSLLEQVVEAQKQIARGHLDVRV